MSDQLARPDSALAAALKRLLAVTDPWRNERDTEAELPARKDAVKALHAAGYSTSLEDARAAAARLAAAPNHHPQGEGR